ncbi:glycosyltransferase [bacterium]|nr:glycosyltransferase [bacterium]
MGDVWVLLQILSIFFLAALIVIAVTNLRNFRKLESYPETKHLPMVSILVPARNEEANIAACIVSLLSQDYPNYEVVVLDDESTDNTWKILKAMMATDKRLRIVKGKRLPPGWIGKPWACKQLMDAAAGDLLLYTDADTRHNPRSLRFAVSAFFSEKADFLTALPKEEALTLGEKLTIPIMSFGISTFFPMTIAHNSASSLFSISVGQFMLFSRKALEAVGGFESVKHCVLDDVELGRRIKQFGLKWRMLDAVNMVNCRMYSNLEEVAEGFSKNLYATFRKKILIYLPVWMWLSLVFIFPFVLLGLVFAGGKIPATNVLLALITVLFSFLVWSITHLRFRYPLYLTFLYPVSVFLWVIMAIRSMLMTITGQNIWKGRAIETENAVEEGEEVHNEYKEKTL